MGNEMTEQTENSETPETNYTSPAQQRALIKVVEQDARARAIVYDPAKGIGAIQRPEDVQRVIQLVETVRKAAVSYTSPTQWMDFGGKPYMQGSAGSAIAALLGLSLSAPKYEYEELPGDAAMVICTVTVFRGERSWTDHDECSSFDDIIQTEIKRLAGKGANTAAIKKIIRSPMQKKACAGAVGRAVSGYVGLRDLDWDTLASLGLTRDKAAARVGFRKGAAGGKIETVHLADFDQMRVGAAAAIKAAQVTEVRTQRGQKGEYADIGVTDDTGRLWLRFWSAPPEWCVAGAWLNTGRVDVKEFQGQKQFHVHELAQIEDRETGQIKEPENADRNLF